MSPTIWYNFLVQIHELVDGCARARMLVCTRMFTKVRTCVLGCAFLFSFFSGIAFGFLYNVREFVGVYCLMTVLRRCINMMKEEEEGIRV